MVFTLETSRKLSIWVYLFLGHPGEIALDSNLFSPAWSSSGCWRRFSEGRHAREHHKETTVRVEDVEALGIGAEPLELGEILVRLLPRGSGPGADELLFERVLLGERLACV